MAQVLLADEAGGSIHLDDTRLEGHAERRHENGRLVTQPAPKDLLLGQLGKDVAFRPLLENGDDVALPDDIGVLFGQ